MREVIIKYRDSKILELLKGLAKYLDFSVSEEKETSDHDKEKVSFTVLHVDTKGYHFNRDEANER